MPDAEVIPVLVYPDALAAAAWLRDAFGFEVRLRIADHRVQSRCGTGAVVVTSGDARVHAGSVLVRVSDVDAHSATARAHGATVASPPVIALRRAAIHGRGLRRRSLDLLANHRGRRPRDVGRRARRCDLAPSASRRVITAPDAPRPPASYSHAIVAAGLVFVSSQGPFDPTTGDVVGTNIQEQTRQCLRNVEAILAAAGSTLSKVVSATYILAEEDDAAGMNEAWARWFPDAPPARTGAKLPIRRKGMKLSVGVIALA